MDYDKIRKIHCTYADMEKYYTAFENISFLPYDFTPTMDQLENEICPNIEQYVVFLLWIDEMGVRTQENELEHNEISNILKHCLILLEDDVDDSCKGKGDQDA